MSLPEFRDRLSNNIDHKPYNPASIPKGNKKSSSDNNDKEEYDRYAEMRSKRLDERADEVLKLRTEKRQESSNFMKAQSLEIQRDKLQSKLNVVGKEINRLQSEKRRIRGFTQQYESSSKKHTLSKTRVKAYVQSITGFEKSKKTLEAKIIELDKKIKSLNPDRKSNLL